MYQTQKIYKKEWNRYYEKLFKESGDEDYDNEFKDFIEEEIPRIENEIMHCKTQGHLSGGPITCKEVEGLIMKMKNNKAPAGYCVLLDSRQNRVSPRISKMCPPSRQP